MMIVVMPIRSMAGICSRKISHELRITSTLLNVAKGYTRLSGALDSAISQKSVLPT